MLNLTGDCQHFAERYDMQSQFRTHVLTSSISCLSRQRTQGFIGSGTTSFGEMLLPLGTCRRQSHKTSTWTPKFIMAWTDFLTDGREMGTEGQWWGYLWRTAGDLGVQLDPTPGRILQWWTSLKHQVKGVMGHSLPVKLKLLRVEGTGPICTATWSAFLNPLSAKNCTPRPRL